MKSISQIITDKFIDEKIIKKEDTEIIEYGVTILLFKIGYILALTVLCLILKRNLVSLFLFYVSYISIRKQSGGYHAKSYISCLGLFLVLYILHQSFIKVAMNVNLIFWSFVLLILFILIYLKSPIDCENKRLTDNQKIEKRKSTLYILLFWVIVFLFLIYFEFKEYALTIIYSFVCITLMLHE